MAGRALKLVAQILASLFLFLVVFLVVAGGSGLPDPPVDPNSALPWLRGE